MILSLAVEITYSQISVGGIPPSFVNDLTGEQFDMRSFPKPDLQTLRQEDQENAQLGYPKPDRIGVSVMVGLDMNTAGTWTDLPDGSITFSKDL